MCASLMFHPFHKFFRLKTRNFDEFKNIFLCANESSLNISTTSDSDVDVDYMLVEREGGWRW